MWQRQHPPLHRTRADDYPHTNASASLRSVVSCGCVLADPPNPDLFALEPDDIHLLCAV